MATKPQTLPEAKPRIVDFLRKIYYQTIHVIPEIAAAMFVFIHAIEASGLAVKADPPLNPNHPNHSKAVPIKVLLIFTVSY